MKINRFRWAVASVISTLILGCASPGPHTEVNSIKIEPLKQPESAISAAPAPKNTPVKPKYGPAITLLRNSHEYVRESRALDYWALSPYYIGTPGECSCSTSLVMIVNAARANFPLTADDKLATTTETLQKVMLPGIDWQERVNKHIGLALDELPLALGRTLSYYGVHQYQLDVVKTPEVNAEIKARVHRDLVENEKSDKNFLLASFKQGAYTGDADVTHISVVGGYDAKRKRVLILDTDREWYEPYWVSEDVFIKGLALAGKDAGYVKVKIIDEAKKSKSRFTLHKTR